MGYLELRLLHDLIMETQAGTLRMRELLDRKSDLIKYSSNLKNMEYEEKNKSVLSNFLRIKF